MLGTWMNFSAEPNRLRHATCTALTMLVCLRLQTLYLHGNRIENIKEVMKLRALPNLVKLTLHGNPMAEKEGYRPNVAAMLPGLKNLDFGTITKVDQDVVKTFFAKRYAPKEEEEEK